MKTDAKIFLTAVALASLATPSVLDSHSMLQDSYSVITSTGTIDWEYAFQILIPSAILGPLLAVATVIITMTTMNAACGTRPLVHEHKAWASLAVAALPLLLFVASTAWNSQANPGSGVNTKTLMVESIALFLTLLAPLSAASLLALASGWTAKKTWRFLRRH